MQISVSKGKEQFSITIDDTDKVSDLKSKLEEETRFPPRRQKLSLLGIPLDSNYDDVLINDLLEPANGLDVDFELDLPKAAGSSDPNQFQNFLLIPGKKLDEIMLQPNWNEDLSRKLPLSKKFNAIGISYGVQGSIDKENRVFSGREYKVSPEATKLRITTDASMDAKIFQTIEKDGVEVEEEIVGCLHSYSEADFGPGKWKKMVQGSKIFANSSTGVGAIFGVIVGILGLGGCIPISE